MKRREYFGTEQVKQITEGIESVHKIILRNKILAVDIKLPGGLVIPNECRQWHIQTETKKTHRHCDLWTESTKGLVKGLNIVIAKFSVIWVFVGKKQLSVKTHFWTMIGLLKRLIENTPSNLGTEQLSAMFYTMRGVCIVVSRKIFWPYLLNHMCLCENVYFRGGILIQSNSSHQTNLGWKIPHTVDTASLDQRG